MACRKYYDGLCMGGSCRTCRHSDEFLLEESKKNNKALGWSLIACGFLLGVTMAVVLS